MLRKPEKLADLNLLNSVRVTSECVSLSQIPFKHAKILYQLTGKKKFYFQNW